MQGNCTGAGPAPAGFGLTEPLPPSACALFVREDFLNTEDKVTLWLSNIYVVVSPNAADNDAVVLFHVRTPPTWHCRGPASAVCC